MFERHQGLDAIPESLPCGNYDNDQVEQLAIQKKKKVSQKCDKRVI